MFERFKDIAELVGLVAVVIGLFFVGFELRQNQISLRAQTRAALAEIDIESIRSLRQDENLMRSRLAENPNASSIDEYREQLWIRELARTAEHQFYQRRIGTFDDEEFQGVRELWKRGFSVPEYRTWWNTYKGEFSTAFRDEFDALLAEE